MRSRRKHVRFLYFGIFFLGALDLVIFLLDPTKTLQLSILSIPPLLLFLLFFFLSIFGIFSYIFKSKRRGALSGLFIVSILILRYFGFKNILYTATLLLITIVLDILFANIKSHRRPKSGKIHI